MKARLPIPYKLYHVRVTKPFWRRWNTHQDSLLASTPENAVLEYFQYQRLRDGDSVEVTSDDDTWTFDVVSTLELEMTSTTVLELDTSPRPPSVLE